MTSENPEPTSETRKPSILEQTEQAIVEWLGERGFPKYRARQILSWIYQRRLDTFHDMSDLPKELRTQLAEHFCIFTGKTAESQHSEDGTEKLLIELADGGRIECVLLRDGPRRSVCISSQVGCAMGCVFCASGLDGVDRNLTRGEILEQMLKLQRLLEPEERLSHIVMMGMGEPLLNFDNVVAAVNLMMDDFAYGLSKRRVTISTSGVVPAMYRLNELCDASLAVSLHAVTDELRNEFTAMQLTD